MKKPNKRRPDRARYGWWTRYYGGKMVQELWASRRPGWFARQRRKPRRHR